MVLMAQEYGADVRLVAFMQYVRSGYAYANEHGQFRNNANPDLTLGIIPGGTSINRP